MAFGVQKLPPGCRLLGPVPPAEIAPQFRDAQQQLQTPGVAGEEIGGAGKEADGVPQQPGDEKEGGDQADEQKQGVGEENGLSGVAADGLDLQVRVRLDGDGVRPVVVEDLKLGGGGRQLPAGVGAEVLEAQFSLRGLRVESGGVGVVGDGEGQLGGGNGPVGPEIAVDALEEPALLGHPLQMTGNTGVVIESEKLKAAFRGFHGAPPFRRCGGNPPPGR